MIPKILFIYPSRGRRERFFKGLDSIVNNVYDKENYFVHVTADYDDPEMNDPSVIQRLSGYPNVGILYGKSISKVNAINRDMPFYEKTDRMIVTVMSDDMEFTVYGFDEVIRQQFADGDFDKLIHLPEPDSKHHLAVLYVAGIDFYRRFGFIYNPLYFSLFCDNEVMEIAQQLGKYYYCNEYGLYAHHNPAYGHLPRDDMFNQQQEIGWTVDQDTYNKRKAINFGL